MRVLRSMALPLLLAVAWRPQARQPAVSAGLLATSRLRLAQTPRMLAPAAATVLPDYAGLCLEADRRLLRLSKKLAKAEEKAAACEARQAELLASDNASLEELERLPPCDQLRQQAVGLTAERNQMVEFVEALRACEPWEHGQPIPEAPPEAVTLVSRAVSLSISDKPPERPPPRPKKTKGPRPSTLPRKPYRVWYSGDTEIRVGRTASDNDKLSLEPEYRDDADWWMHVAGCPGSHVVIRAETLASSSHLPDDVAMDAAVLAANNSRAVLSGRVGVNLCRARQVSKPVGAKPGLVRLSGDVTTIKVDWRKERHRLERLGQPVS